MRQIILEHGKNNGTYKNDHQIDKTTISYYMQEIENRILEQVYLFCVDRKLITDNICSLCYDGKMILKEKYFDGLLSDLNQLILNKFGLDTERDG